jgi:hypothetical protein
MRFKDWPLRQRIEDVTGPEAKEGQEQHPWWQVVCRTGVDSSSLIMHTSGLARCRGLARERGLPNQILMPNPVHQKGTKVSANAHPLATLVEWIPSPAFAGTSPSGMTTVRYCQVYLQSGPGQVQVDSRSARSYLAEVLTSAG